MQPVFLGKGKQVVCDPPSCTIAGYMPFHNGGTLRGEGEAAKQPSSCKTPYSNIEGQGPLPYIWSPPPPKWMWGLWGWGNIGNLKPPLKQGGPQILAPLKEIGTGVPLITHSQKKSNVNQHTDTL